MGCEELVDYGFFGGAGILYLGGGFVSCKKCDNGWVEVDDMPVLCKCQATSEPVQSYVNRIKEHMGLSEWVIEVQATPADDGNLAEIDCVYGQRRALLFVCEEWHGLPPETQRSTLAHEMLHAHVSGLAQMLHDTIDPVLKKGERRIVEAAFRLCEEHMVDTIALAWAATLPLPNGGSK